MIPTRLLRDKIRLSMATGTAVGLKRVEDQELFVVPVVADFVLAPGTELGDLELHSSESDLLLAQRKTVAVGDQLHGVETVSGNDMVILKPLTDWFFVGDTATPETPVVIHGFALVNEIVTELYALEKLDEPVTINDSGQGYEHPSFIIRLPVDAFI